MFIIIANRYAVNVVIDAPWPAFQYLQREYAQICSEDAASLPVAGIITFSEAVVFPSEAIELRKDMLYETSDALYIHHGTTTIRLVATPERFDLRIHPASDPELTFFTLEMLIRIYAPLYGLVFLHTGAFIHDGRAVAISAFGGVGKTETMLYALERGAQFLADDFAIFNEKGQIFPYTKRINLCEYPYTDRMLRRLHKRKWLFQLKQYCQRHPGRFTSHLADFLESRYFGVKISYVEVTCQETPLQFYAVDDFYWAESSNKTGRATITPREFVDKMMLCLDIESRRYFDYDGYLRLKFPFLATHKQNQREVLEQIVAHNEVKAVTIRGREFDELAELVLGNNVSSERKS